MKKSKDKSIVISIRFTVEQRDFLEAQATAIEKSFPGLRIGNAEIVRMMVERFMLGGKSL